MMRPPPRSTLFPYTPLSRSRVPLDPQLCDAAGNRPALAAVFPPQRGDARHEADGVRHREGSEAPLARDEAGGEVAAHRSGEDVPVDRRPYRVQATRGAHDPGDA